MAIKEVLDSAVEAACEVLGTDAAAIGLLEGDRVTLRSHQGLSKKFAARYRPKKDESVTGLVFRTGEPFASSDLTFEADSADAAAVKEGIKGGLVVPLKVGGEVVGCLYMGHRTPREFAARELRIASALGEQVSKSLENACLLEQERRHRQRAEHLLEVVSAISPGLSLRKVVIKICQAVVKLSVADRCSIFLRDEETGRSEPYMSLGLEDPELWQRFQNSEGVSPADVEGLEEAWRTLTPAIQEHVPGSRFLPDYWVNVFAIKSIAIYPLIVRDKPVGVMSVDSFRDFVSFPAEEVEILTAVAQQIAVIIDNARLFEQERRQRERAEHLLEVSNAARSGLGLKKVLVKLCKTVEQLSVAERCSIFLVYDEGRRLEPLMSIGVEDQQMWQKFRSMGSGAPGGRTSRMMAALNRMREPHVEEDASDSKVLPRAWLTPFNVKSIALYPLVVKDELRGIMVVDAFSKQVRFPREEVETLRAIANQAAVIIENARLYEQLQEQAITDFLTGVNNHRYLRDRLEEELARTDRTGHPMAIMMLDLDHFALFNDTYGHPAGDAVLRNVVSVLSSVCRVTDIVGRYGGDEFMVILPNTNKKQAGRVAERIRSRLAKERFLIGAEAAEVTVTVSIGITSCPEDGSRSEHLIFEADAALYEAKRRGGNSVIVSGCPTEETLRSRGSAFGITQRLASALGEKEPYAKDHHLMAVRFANLMAEGLALPEEERDALRKAAVLHDIGNLAIPDNVLLKPKPLNRREWQVVRRHVRFSESILGAVAELSDAAAAVVAHHERWDGSGYPRGLKGEEIPLLGRVMALVDAYSSMTSDRPYRRAMNDEEAVQELKANAGTQFDPHLVDVFLRVTGREDSQKRAPARGRAA